MNCHAFYSAAALATTKFQVGELDTRLKASSRALEEAQAEIVKLKAKKQQEIEAAIKSAERAVTHAKAETSKDEEMLSKKNADQDTREKHGQLRLEDLSASFGGKG
jgi:hypothetical protein